MSHRWQEDEIQGARNFWELTPTEYDELRCLKDRLADIDHWRNEPYTVVRFMRARPGNVKASEDMFRKMIEWRRDNDVDNILETYHPPAEMLAYTPGAILEGVDKEGDPIYVGRAGVTDIVGMYKRYGREEIIRYAIWIRELVVRGEWQQEYEARHGRKMKRITLIEDLHGLSAKVVFSYRVIKLYGEVVRMDQDYYCESAKKLIIIRAPSIFPRAWALAKAFFDPAVVEKMVFTDSNDYLEVLDQYLDFTVLPSTICDEGKGRAAKGMPSHFKGGFIPEEKNMEETV